MTTRAARKLRIELKRLHGRIALGVGASRRTQPLCEDFGGTRGTPIDRYYIEQFLAENAADLRGHVLEVADDSYSRQFGAEKVTRTDILSLEPGPRVTIVGDLGALGTLPSGRFDCIILTQTLQLVYDLRTAAKQLRSALRSGGVLLVTVPGITAIDRYSCKSGWYWSFTVDALRRVLGEAFDKDRVGVRAYGNLYAATTFLQGACLQEVNRRKLNLFDEAYPVIVAARAIG